MKKTTRAFLDRIESSKAVLLIGDNEEDTVIIPVKYLPDNISEGTVLNICFEEMLQETEDIRNDVQRLINRLKNNQ